MTQIITYKNNYTHILQLIFHLFLLLIFLLQHEAHQIISLHVFCISSEDACFQQFPSKTPSQQINCIIISDGWKIEQNCSLHLNEKRMQHFPDIKLQFKGFRIKRSNFTSKVHASPPKENDTFYSSIKLWATNHTPIFTLIDKKSNNQEFFETYLQFDK